MEAPKYRKRIYSGICMCGHSYEDHHTSVVMNIDYFKATGEYVIPDECDYFGCNEDGGRDEQGDPHCFSYVDAEDPSEERKSKWEGTER